MMSEVLQYLIMITCILIRVSSKEVKWTVRDTSIKLGQDLTLFCEVDNCTVHETKRWQGGPDDKVLMLYNGNSNDKAKYSTSIEKNGFILTILNLTVKDLNVSYECSCGVDSDKHSLHIEDVDTDTTTLSTYQELTPPVDNLNKTTNGTSYIGTNDVDGIPSYVLPISIAVILVIVLIIVIVAIKKCGLWRSLKEKIYDPRRRNPATSNHRVIPTDEDSQSSGSSLQSADVNLNQIQCTDEVDSQNVTDPFSRTTPVDFNQRKSSGSSLKFAAVNLNQIQYIDEDNSQNVTDPSLHTTAVDFNQRKSSGSSLQSADENLNQIQCTDEVDSQNVTDPLSRTTPVDFNQRKSSGSSLQYADENLNQIQCTDKVDSQNVTDPLSRTTPLDFNQRKSSGSSLQSADLNLNQIQCTDEVDSQNETDPLLHTIPVDFNLRQSEAAESFEPSTSREASSESQRSSSSITGTERRESLETNSNKPVSPGKRHMEYANIELREKTFKTWPLKKPTIVQLAEAGFFHSGYENIAQCFSCGNKIHWKEDWNPLDEAFHNKCEHLRQITSTQLKTAYSPDQ